MNNNRVLHANAATQELEKFLTHVAELEAEDAWRTDKGRQVEAAKQSTRTIIKTGAWGTNLNQN